MKNIMKLFAKRLACAALALAAGAFASAAQAAEAGNLAYSNIHGLLKITSPTANTMIPAPWKGYTRDGSPTNDIRVDRMVKPRNLTDGDRLLLRCEGDGVPEITYFKVWILKKNGAAGEGEWVPQEAERVNVDVAVKGTVEVDLRPDGDERQRRGYGMWLERQNPRDAQGNPLSFYLYGQWMTGEETITLGGGTVETPTCTMIANPGVDDVKANDLPWENVYEGTEINNCDTLIRPNGSTASDYIYRMNGQWQFSVIVPYTDAKGRTRLRTEFTTDIPFGEGRGFWYVRRTPEPTSFTWPGGPQYPGEGKDLDVWIVDHADAGDGKTHLAFKLEGALAPETVTPAFIKELFDSGCIRYLHATGETRAAGKAEMDRLTADPVNNARLVPALRNGTGVNTPEELAKGWIWVTVDATDGTNAADSEKDGTGDTNGAGDLWRIVVGKGVWAP